MEDFPRLLLGFVERFGVRRQSILDTVPKKIRWCFGFSGSFKLPSFQSTTAF